MAEGYTEVAAVLKGYARFAEVIMGRVCNDIDRMKLNTSIDRGVVL
jgi:hypothetical protein